MLLYAGFLLSVFLDYVRPGSYLPLIEVARLNSVVPLAVFVATIFHKSEVSDREFFNHQNSRWLLFFLLILLVSILFSDVTEYSFNVFTTVLGFIFWYYIIVKLVTNELRVRLLFGVLVFSHILLLLLNPDLILRPELRAYIQNNAFLGDGNDYSLSVTVTLPMCLYLLIRSKSLWARGLWVASLLVLILGIIGTQSRGATIALVGVLLFLWLKGRHKTKGMILIGALVAGVVSYAPDVYFDRLNTIAAYEEEGSAVGRIIAWKAALRMVEKYPVLGVGSGHFAVKLGTEFRPPEWGGRNLRWATAHSMYFLLIGELGIPGITFLLAMLIGNYLRNNKLMREALERQSELSKLFMMLNASLVAFAIGGTFLSVAYYPHLYVLTGIWAAASFIHRRSLSDERDAHLKETPEQRAKRLIWSDGNGKQLDVIQ